MQNEEDRNIELISRYLAGRLPGAEAEEFRQRLKDPSFQEEVDLQRELAEAVGRREASRLKALLQAEEADLEKEAAPGARHPGARRRRFIGLAAAAALLLLAAAFWFLGREPAAPDLYASYFEPRKNTLVVVQRTEGEESLMQKAFLLYEDEEYEEALDAFAALPDTAVTDDVAFYRANALMAVGRTKEALPILQEVVRNGESQYLDSAKWYLALAYVDEAQYAAARPLLEELRSSPFLGKKAEALLRERAFR